MGTHSRITRTNKCGPVRHDRHYRIEELAAGHDGATGMWSDGRTLWLAHNGDGANDAIYAYDLESGERVAEREFQLDTRNRAPCGVWSDGVTMWISDSDQTSSSHTTSPAASA